MGNPGCYPHTTPSYSIFFSTPHGPLSRVSRRLSKTMAGPFKGLKFHHLHFFPLDSQHSPFHIPFCCSVISFHLPFFFFFYHPYLGLDYFFSTFSLWSHAFVIEVWVGRIHSLIKCPLKMNEKLQGEKASIL